MKDIIETSADSNATTHQVVKPVVETDISRAANSFAKDSTNIKYRSEAKLRHGIRHLKSYNRGLKFKLVRDAFPTVGGMRRRPSRRR